MNLRKGSLSVAAPLALLVVFAAGCDTVLTTVQLPTVREDGVVGEWKDLGTPDSKPDQSTLVIRFENGEYLAISPDEKVDDNTSRFTLARVGDLLIEQEKQECSGFNVPNGQSCWSLGRMELAGDQLNLYEFDATLLAQESISGTLNLPHTIRRERNKDGSFDTSVLLASDRDGLGRFLESYVKRPGAFRLTGRMQRLAPKPRP